MNPLLALRRIIRSDSWINSTSGIGDPLWDRAVGTSFVPNPPLDTAILTALFRDNGLCRRIVSVFPEEALRRKPTFEGPDAKEVETEFERLNVRATIELGLIWARLYGGAVAVICTDDGGDPRTPLGKGPHRIIGIDLYDKREVYREAQFTDPTENPYGQTRIFRIQPFYGGTSYVHRSRCLVFGSVKTDALTKISNNGWDDSALQAPYDVIRAFESGYSALGNMLTDASQAVLKIGGLIAAIGEKDGVSILAKRAQIMSLGRSIAKALFLDADNNEEYQKVATSFAGVPEAIDRIGNRLAAETEIPVTVLMGQAPAGLNATGESDRAVWGAKCTAYRGVEVEPQYHRLLQIGYPGHTAKWPPLQEPTEKEAADTRLATANADEKYILNNVVTPEEVALTRRGPLDVKIRPELRKVAPEASAAPPPPAAPKAPPPDAPQAPAPTKA